MRTVPAVLAWLWAGESAMVSKCANPECSEIFRYLSRGKIFRLAPTPAVQAAAVTMGSLLTERFWLCDRCSREMTVIWDGARAKIVPLPKKVEKVAALPLPLEVPHKGPTKVEVQAAQPRVASATGEGL